VATGGKAWIVRAGREGRDEGLALSEQVAVIGWSEVGPLESPVTRDSLKAAVADSQPAASAPSIAAQAGQIYRFVHDIAAGDLVVLPLLADPGHFAVGRIRGPYAFRDDGPFTASDAKHTRPVEWLSESVSYERLPADLRSALGAQGTVSEIVKPDAARRIVAATTLQGDHALHLLLRWRAADEPRTIALHREIVESNGAVWWGKFGDPNSGRAAMASERYRDIQRQLDDGVPTYVFLHRKTEVWRTSLVALERERPDSEASLIPAYYRDEVGKQHLWLKLRGFEQVDLDFAQTRLLLDGSTDPAGMSRALKGRASLLYVRMRQDGDRPVVWWVNQGESYARALDDGYLWAPKLTKRGQRKRDWDALLQARPGQLVLSYAAGHLKAVGTVTTEAFDASRPATFSDDLWSEDGRRVDIDYRLLDEPIALGDIPTSWRTDAGGPFNRNGGVKLGYFFRLPDSFVSRLAERFPQLAIDGNHQQSHDQRLTADALRRKAESPPYGLRLDPGIYATVVAALESGKHIILTGPPGTAKTTLAQAVAHTAHELGLSSGHLLTTATADWTTYETIGGLKPSGSNALEFERGHFLEAIENRQWLVIDELNRSQFDRAFGQLFTVLSGQPVTLPHRRPNAEGPLTLLPEGAEPPQGPSDVIPIPREWRIVATMNVFDKSLLFEMSYALMRRFAFIEVSSPSDEVFDELIGRWSEGSAVAADTAKALLAVRSVKDIGPAVYRDIARFATQRLRQGPVRDGELRQQAFYSYLLPQFEGITDEQGDRLLKILGKGVGGASVSKLRETLNTVLGLELAAPVSSRGEIEELQEALDESPSGG
jgi:MoxR-like ATPase